jgi:MscS family membrane protein
MAWRDGVAQLHLEQEGSVVVGTLPLTAGRIEATAAGEQLTGIWTRDGAAVPVQFMLSRDRRSFVAREIGGTWWTGIRSQPVTLSIPGGLETPRAALRRFVVAGELARAGAVDAWAEAAATVVFGSDTAAQPREAALERTRGLFELVDLTTFRLETIPELIVEDEATVVLEQPHTLAGLPLEFVRDGEGAWRIAAPAPAELATLRAALLANFGGRPSKDAFRMRRSARDAMRAFLDGMSEWENGGRRQALEALDLSAYPEVVREDLGEMAAHFLRRALDRIGMAGLQAFPNQGTDRSPYVHFVHPEGRIALAPAGPEPDAPWVFTADTVADSEDLYRALDNLPPPLVTPPGRVPAASFFAVREGIAAAAPALLGRVRRLEYWQILGAAAVLTFAGSVGAVVARAAARGLAALGADGHQPRWFFLAVGLTVAMATAAPFPPVLGIPPHIRSVVVPVLASLAIVLAAAVLWRLLQILERRLAAAAQQTLGMGDDIMVSLAFAALRGGLIVAAALAVAHVVSIPTAGILAGLGIGGLAVAYASRETLSNVFGALVLVSDRPFRRGDWIIAQHIAGTIEHVGIRSTRIRDADGGLIVVPNGKLADSSIQNMSAGPHRLIRLQVPVTSAATSEELAAFIDAARDRLASDPAFAPEDALVGIESVSLAGTEVSISARLAGRDSGLLATARQQLFLDLLRLAERHGLKLGPSR